MWCGVCVCGVCVCGVVCVWCGVCVFYMLIYYEHVNAGYVIVRQNKPRIFVITHLITWIMHNISLDVLRIIGLDLFQDLDLTLSNTQQFKGLDHQETWWRSG